MANRWGNSGNCDRLYFLGSKITADGDHSHESERHLLLGRKVLTNLDSILKSRDYFANKGPSSQSYGFSSNRVWMGCESWTIKKVEHQRTDAFELWCWRRLLESLGQQEDPTSPSYRKSVLNIHWKDWCWSWNSNILAPRCEELIHSKRPWSWERLKVGGEGDNRGWDGWMESPTQWTWVWVNSGSQWWTGGPGMLQSMESQRVGNDSATELNWRHNLDFSLCCFYWSMRGGSNFSYSKLS